MGFNKLLGHDKRINSYFLLNGFVRSENEPTLYMKKCEKGGFLVVCIYLDDMIYRVFCQKGPNKIQVLWGRT